MGGDHLYNCEHCYENEGYLTLLGHDGPPQGLWDKNLIDGRPLERCPMMDLISAAPEKRREITIMRTELYPLYREGHLLEGGGVADQPARYMEFMREFDGVATASEAAYHKHMHGGDDEDEPT